MRHAKLFKQLNDLSPGRNVGYITGRAKRGAGEELASAKELHALLRDYTYHLIGLGNTFRDIARTYGKFHGSNWRTYRGVRGEALKALAERLNEIDPYDVDAVLKVETAIEELAKTLKQSDSTAKTKE